MRCFSCGKVVGDKWNTYLQLLAADVAEGFVLLFALTSLCPVDWLLSSLFFVSVFNRDALDQLQLKRYCCRRMVLTHVDLIEKLLQYNRAWLFISCLLIGSESNVYSCWANEGQVKLCVVLSSSVLLCIISRAIPLMPFMTSAYESTCRAIMRTFVCCGRHAQLWHGIEDVPHLAFDFSLKFVPQGIFPRSIVCQALYSISSLN